MKEESQHPSIDPQLEARIVALVLGEAADFERDELNRLMDVRPELAAFKAHIESVHGLLQGVGEGEVGVDEDWKLPAERRRAVLGFLTESWSGPRCPSTVALEGRDLGREPRSGS